VSKKLLIVGAVLFILVSFSVDYAILSRHSSDAIPLVSSIIETENPPVSQPIRALFVGDIMLDRWVANHAAKYGTASLFANIRPLFEGNDLIVGNLEGTITSQPSVTQNGSGLLQFTFSPQLVRDTLVPLGFTAVSIANNHTLNFGQSGYEETKTNLVKDAILSFGSPSNSENLSTQKEINGKLFCLVGYEEFINSDPQPILDEIRSLRTSCYRIIVFTHWGVEYIPEPTDNQKALAHAFIDAGADVIIGSHPHIVQPLEIYKNKAIFYSLGNFMFDQYFSFETTHGLAVQIDFSDAETHFTLVPVTILNEEASFASFDDQNQVFRELAVETNNFSLKINPTR
jgi:poly-gamma-glutamate synthesis protein (capsule biosynthesis protein)